jgi:sulfide:quinone oxidoreductase
MNIKSLTPRFSAASQLYPQDVQAVAQAGFRSIICTRPDGEDADQPPAAQIETAAWAAGLEFAHLPVVPNSLTDANVAAMRAELDDLPAPVLAYCRSGARAEKLAEMAGVLGGGTDASHYDIVIVGGGSAGIATAASILKRRRGIRLAIVEPSDVHYYQPGWTMVGAGVFNSAFTRRDEAHLIPPGAEWIRGSVELFHPEEKQVVLSDRRRISYAVLIVCPGIKLDWTAIPGLAKTLGQNGVTSNYRYDLAPYTNRLARDFQGGRALFTQPVMPIKCAGAPQKAMYLSCHRWEKSGVLARSNVQFHTAGAVLFGVPDYVPALMNYVGRYGIHLNFGSKLVEIDGPARTAIFERTDDSGVRRVAERFDMIHVVPPQVAPDFIRNSPLAAASGFVEVDETTLRHPRYPDIFGLGDACSASNAKTAAAARKQAPVVAVNALAALDGKAPVAAYDGYGSCPLTVEAGKIVLAEFGYGGKLLPSFPKWLIDGTRPSRLSWLLKDTILPPVYWHGMLKGREWMVNPQPIDAGTRP